MAVYLVTYDLNKETSRPNIVGLVRKYGAWARLSESSYAIVTDGTPSDVYQTFRQVLDDNDQLYVITLKKPWDGQGGPDVNTWLENNLPW